MHGSIYGKQFLGGQGKGISAVSVDKDFFKLKDVAIKCHNMLLL